MAEITIHLDLDDRRDKLSYEYFYAQPAIHNFFEDLNMWINTVRESKHSRPASRDSLLIPDKIAEGILERIMDLRFKYNLEQLIQEQRCLDKENCQCKAIEGGSCTTCDRWQ